MAAVSPTPMATGDVQRASRRHPTLRRLPSRTRLATNDKQLPSAAGTNSSSNGSGRAQPQQQYRHDSSEDEIPVPVKLSALTKALLDDGAPAAVERAPERRRRRTSQLSASSHDQRPSRAPAAQAVDAGRPARPPSGETSPVRKRVVRLSSTPQSLGQIRPSQRRSTSASRASGAQRPASRTGAWDKSADERPESRQGRRPDVNTPARVERVVRIVSGSSANRGRVASAAPSSGRSNRDRSAVDGSAIGSATSAIGSAASAIGSANEADPEQPEPPETVARSSANGSYGSVSCHPSTRSRSDDNANLQSSMRVKRVGNIPGSFLNGPARRARRRQSEEDAEDIGEGDRMLPGQDAEVRLADHAPDASYFADGIRSFNSGSPVSGNAASRAIQRRYASDADLHASASARPPSRSTRTEARNADEMRHGQPPPRVDMPAALDQENLPANYKRQKSDAEHVVDKVPWRPLSVEVPWRPLSVEVGVAKAAEPERKPLAPLATLAHNTPRRPAPPPPPPKMSVFEAAMSTAGAAAAKTTQAKQRRNVLRVNGKCYTRLDCLGRGGSAKVYRVTAENGNMFALKRVSLENADETTVRGYKGEIDLLRRLSGVDRVIKLFDHEMNSEKQVLTLLMEMGELDLNKLLTSRQNPEQAKLDAVFVRFYWKEMLECLQSVHRYDIVHSDLKPANFVLVRGRLKLIDFGIANAIQTDETVNVHRETQIGTPNYMSPESLMDANNPRGGRVPGRPKLMKLGKPSDVWSLGCILYQMVYGLPPFGHIANQMARCQAIINWDHDVEFPSRAMGGVPVPPSLLRTMRRCLDREQHMRPTCEELLHETDPFLYPVELGDTALSIDEELLARVIQSVVARCRERMPTEAESMTLLPKAYWSSIRKATAGDV